jgi:hypothetical protein
MEGGVITTLGGVTTTDGIAGIELAGVEFGTLGVLLGVAGVEFGTLGVEFGMFGVLLGVTAEGGVTAGGTTMGVPIQGCTVGGVVTTVGGTTEIWG